MPSVLVLQDAFEEDGVEVTMGADWVTTAIVEAVQPLASVTKTVYVFAPRLVTVVPASTPGDHW